MPRPPATEPTLDEHGAETHPAFGVVKVSRVHHSPPGKVLFDSEIRHSHYVTLTVKTATRQRDLNRDWIHSSRELVEVAMSEAQWAQLVSSFGDSGVPVTIGHVGGEMTPDLPFAPRLALSAEETRAAADRAFSRIKEAVAAVEEKPTKANIRALRAAVDNAPRNVKFAADSLSEHTENVVTKARADVEAMIDARAHALGLTAEQTPRIALTEGDPS